MFIYQFNIYLVDLYTRLTGAQVTVPEFDRRVYDVNGEEIVAILARPEFLPATLQNRVLSVRSTNEENIAPIQLHTTNDCFLEEPRYTEEECKKVRNAFFLDIIFRSSYLNTYNSSAYLLSDSKCDRLVLKRLFSDFNQKTRLFDVGY